MAVKKTKNKATDFITKTLKNDLKTIVSEVINKNRNLTAADIDVLTIKKTANGYVLEYNDGTPTEPPTVEVIQTDEMDGTEDPEMYREGLLELLYNIAMWSGYEYNPKGNNNLDINWNLVGEDLTESNENDDSETDKKFSPPTKEQVLAAAMGNRDPLIPDNPLSDDEDLPDVDDGVRYDDELDSNEWVAGDDYSGSEDDIEEFESDDDGYNEEFEDE